MLLWAAAQKSVKATALNNLNIYLTFLFYNGIEVVDGASLFFLKKIIF